MPGLRGDEVEEELDLQKLRDECVCVCVCVKGETGTTRRRKQ